MGTISKGILGPFHGKVGTVIGSTWKGIPYIRSVSAKPRRPSTPGQLEQQAKFNLVVRFTAPMADLFRTTFSNFADKMSGINCAQSYILKNAIVGKYPNYSIDHRLVLVSRGDLPIAHSAAANTIGDYVNFTWQPNAGLGRAKETDRAIMLACCPALRSALFSLAGPERQTGAGSLNVSLLRGNSVHTWLAFISADKKAVVSDSVYTGEWVIE